jgi:hypothetical protein
MGVGVVRDQELKLEDGKASQGVPKGEREVNRRREVCEWDG